MGTTRFVYSKLVALSLTAACAAACDGDQAVGSDGAVSERSAELEGGRLEQLDLDDEISETSGGVDAHSELDHDDEFGEGDESDDSVGPVDDGLGGEGGGLPGGELDDDDICAALDGVAGWWWWWFGPQPVGVDEPVQVEPGCPGHDPFCTLGAALLCPYCIPPEPKNYYLQEDASAAIVMGPTVDEYEALVFEFSYYNSRWPAFQAVVEPSTQEHATSALMYSTRASTTGLTRVRVLGQRTGSRQLEEFELQDVLVVEDVVVVDIPGELE